MIENYAFMIILFMMQAEQNMIFFFLCFLANLVNWTCLGFLFGARIRKVIGYIAKALIKNK